MHNTKKSWRIALLLFLLYLIVMTPLMGRKKGYTVDATPAFQLTQSIIEDQTFFPEDTVKQGYIYSIAYIPFYGMGSLIAPFFETVEPEWIQRKMMCWMNTVITAITVAVLSLILRTLNFSKVAQICIPLFYGFSTLAFAYARYDYNKCLAALLIVLAFWVYLLTLKHKKYSLYFFCGLSTGLLIMLRAEMAVIVLILGIAIVVDLLKYHQALTPTLSQREMEKRTADLNMNQPMGRITPFILFALPIVIGGLFFLIYNMIYWQGDIAGGYEGGFTTNFLPGLIGFLFSPGKSVLIYNPILFLLPFCFRKFYNTHSNVFWTWLSLWASLLLVYSAWLYWWGGWGWGPRHLVPLLPIMCIPLATLLDQGRPIEKITLAILAFIGLCIQFLGTMVDFNDVIMMLYNNNISEQALIWEPIWSQLVHHYLLLEHITLSRMDYGLIYLWLNWPTWGFIIFVLIWFILISVIMTQLIVETKK